LPYHHFSAKNAYNEIKMTFDALLEQQFESELGVISVIAAKSSLELKYEAPKSHSSVFEFQ
jgi:hypothetical protein